MEQEIFDTEFFNKLNTLKLSIRMRLNKGMGGGRKSTAKGSSVEFSDFREYMLGDDIRRIDWNAYGRLDKLYIKQYMEEKEGIFNVFIDTSKSMDYGEYKKSVRAQQLAGALAYIILNNLDRVYVTQVREGQLTVGKGVTEDAIKYLLYKKQEIVLIQVLAREEVDVTLEGTVNLTDIETGEEMKITVTKSVIDRYMTELQGLKNNLEKMAKKYHMTYMSTVSDESFDKVLFEGFKNTGFIM